MSKEIITLQLGNFANHVGAQFWNIQGSAFVYDQTKDPDVNNDILFREGLTHNGSVTYTPRLILADLKGGFGLVKLNGDLYDDGPQNLDEIEEECRDYVWSESSLTTHVTDSYSKNVNGKKQESLESNGNGTTSSPSKVKENEIKNWSDHMQMPLHPNSTVVVRDYLHNPHQQDFNLWSQGSTMASQKLFEEFEEKIRFFAEECDNLQGFHVLCDVNNGFGGLSHSISNYLNDEFLNKSVCLFPVQPTIPTAESLSNKLRAAVTSSLTVASLLETSTSVSPLSLFNDFVPNRHEYRKLPFILYDIESDYHTSSILSSALENLTLSYRTHSSSSLIGDYFSNISPGRRNLLSTGISLPFPLNSKLSYLNNYSTNLADSLVYEYADDVPWIEMMPQVDLNSECVAQNSTLRGLTNAQLLPKNKTEKNSHKLIYKCNRADDMLQLYLNEKYCGCRSFVGTCREPMIIPKTYPKFFDESVQWNGSIYATKKSFTNGNSASRTNGHQTDYTTRPLGSDFSYSNGSSHNGSNSHQNGHSRNGHMAKVQVFNEEPPSVASLPVSTTVQCSTSSVEYIREARRILSNCKRPFYREQHKLEEEEFSQFSESLNNLFDLYVTHNNKSDSSDDESVDF